MSRLKQQDGFVMPTVLSLIIALGIITSAVALLISTNMGVVNNNVKSQKAFNIAEAGVNYYLWHLSHSPSDYKDGKSTPATPDTTLGYGPYVHNYYDDNAVLQGTYTLWIKPEPNSTIAKVRSIGNVAGSTITRTVEAQLGAPSFASYGIVADSALWFGENEAADGPIHSNQGIRMDGPSNSTITASNATYTPPSSSGGDGSSKPGVWCHPSITTPVNCATRSKADWSYPSPLVDFNQISGSLCTMKKVAFADYSATSALATQSNACAQTPTTRTNAYLPQRSSSANKSRGYLVELNANGTYNVYNVNNEKDTQANYSDALTPQTVAVNIPVPPSGVLFVEDNVWVRTNPTFTGRLTIASGRLATSVSTNITIADDLAYTSKNGSDVIGLVAESSVEIAPYAAPASGSFTLEVDAAILAASGNVVFRQMYNFASSTCTRGWVNPSQKLNFYGSIAVRQTWTWSWVGNSCGDRVYSNPYYYSGFKYNTTTYDYNLLFGPPPSFPMTSSFTILNWREVLTRP